MGDPGRHAMPAPDGFVNATISSHLTENVARCVELSFSLKRFA